MSSIILRSFPTSFHLEYNHLMNDLYTLLPQNLYHSYIIEADPEATAPILLAHLKERGDIDNTNLDVLYQLYDSFTFNDCSLVKEWHSKLGVTSKSRVCIIGTKFINSEAERALLKILEEPAIRTHFFIVVPNAQVLLDTILSRAHVIRLSNTRNIVNNKNAETFISLSANDRIEHISQIIKNNKDNENSGGLRYDAIDLINGIEKVIHDRFLKDKTNKEYRFILEELEKGRQYLGTSGASVKMILEHIALVI